MKPVLSCREYHKPVTVMRVREIFPSLPIHNPEFFNATKDSIEEDGLIHPIVIMPMTIGFWKQLREITASILPPPEGDDDQVVMQIRCGNNRYYAAKQLRYDLVDCVKVYSFMECNQECLYQRKKM